jgi:hypothetical protein
LVGGLIEFKHSKPLLGQRTIGTRIKPRAQHDELRDVDNAGGRRRKSR